MRGPGEREGRGREEEVACRGGKDSSTASSWFVAEAKAAQVCEIFHYLPIRLAHVCLARDSEVMT